MLDGLHKALFELLQSYATEHGVQVQAINADWIDVSTVDHQRNVLRTITIESSKLGP